MLPAALDPCVLPAALGPWVVLAAPDPFVLPAEMKVEPHHANATAEEAALRR